MKAGEIKTQGGELLDAIVCWLFHGRHVSQRNAAGDWVSMHCRKCDYDWSEPRR